jgi:hypothetical protein
MARGAFHEERGAIIMLQAAARRKKAMDDVAEKTMTKLDQHAEVIQGGWRTHQRRKARTGAKKGGARANSPGVLTKLARSLSFSKRKGKDKEGSVSTAEHRRAPQSTAEHREWSPRAPSFAPAL